MIHGRRAAPIPVGASGLPGIAEPLRDDLVEREVREFMTPACVALSENASVADAAEALARHRVHALLVIGATNGTPLGWVTARGLLHWLSRDRSLASARCSLRLSMAGTTRLLVRSKLHLTPEGVITDFDLAVAARP